MKMFRGATAVAAIAGAMLSANAQAVNLTSDGTGEVAIAPFYTVRNDWSTLINLTNTSSDPILVKVRFHEAHNSRDSLDFNVALSGNDVFVAEVSLKNGVATLTEAVDDDFDGTGKRTCTVPQIPAAGVPLNRGAYTNSGAANNTQFQNDDGGIDTNDRLSEGYIEFIVMGRALGTKGDSVANPTAPNSAIGNAIENHDCATLNTRLGGTGNAASDGLAILAASQQFGEPVNALKFNFRLINRLNGVEAGTTATTWANFYNEGNVPLSAPRQQNGQYAAGVTAATIGADATCTITRGAARRGGAVWTPGDGVGNSCPNLVTLQRPNAFLEPSLNDAFPAVANDWNDNLNAAISRTPVAVGGNTRGVDAVSLTLMSRAVINEWALRFDANNVGVATDWIITQPTKSFYVDRSTTVTQAGIPALGAGVTLGNGTTDLGRPEADPGVNSMPLAPYQRNFAQTTAGVRASAKSCNEIGTQLYDRAEQVRGGSDGSGVPFSPQPVQPPTTVELCYEANVVTFNNSESGETVGRSALQFTAADTSGALNRLRDGSGNATFVDLKGLPNNDKNGNGVIDAGEGGNVNGWLRLNLAVGAQKALVPATNVPNDLNRTNPALAYTDPVNGNGAAAGLPVTGFALKVRNFGDASSNYASGTDHAYIRN